MKSIRFRLLIAALAVLVGSAIAKSQTTSEVSMPPAHGHEYGRGGHMMGFFAKKLNLTDDQKAQMKAIMQKEHPTMKPLFQQQRQIEAQLRQYVQGTYDETKVRALATQKAQIEVELTVAQTRVHNQMYQILTGDQQAQLKEMQARHEARMQERMQQHMNHEPPAAPEQ